MPDYYFDPYLDHLRADRLKQIARLWGGSSKLRRDECAPLIRQGLSSPEKVRAALATLNTFERNVLALLKRLGGAADASALYVALLAGGIEIPRRARGRDDAATFGNNLIARGLVLSASHDPGALYSYSFYSNALHEFADARMLAQVTWSIETEPLRLSPVSPPAATLYRRPPAVALDIIGLLQTLEDMGGVGVTQKGALRINDVKKIAKAMRWAADTLTLDGFTFPEPAQAFAHAFLHSGLSSHQGSMVVLNVSPGEFAQLSYVEQVERLLYGFTHAVEWHERGDLHWGYYQSNLSLGRLALLLLLTALPSGSAFFDLDAFDAAIFERIGENFSLYALPQYPYTYGKTPAEQKSLVDAWRTKLRADWLKKEKVWLTAALTTWLYYLGVVELGMANGAPVSFRLTELGRAVLLGHKPPASAPGKSDAQQGPRWIVQPNLEVLVYLEHVTPEQLAFIERHAERLGAQQHTAQYRLTRESVYQALERGSTLEALLTGLTQGSGMALPQNVAVELREWAGLRERITLYRGARLAEFADAPTRAAALQGGLAGRPVGERFLLLEASTRHRWADKIDYRQPLPKCLLAAEDGLLTLSPASKDLLIHGQLDVWAERESDTTWRLTAASVKAARKAGARIETLLAWLAARLIVPLPPFLRTVLLSWSGMQVDVGLADVIVLQCRQQEVFDALAGSLLLRPLLAGVLAPDLLLVESAALDALRERLQWAGFEVTDALIVRRSPKFG